MTKSNSDNEVKKRSTHKASGSTFSQQRYSPADVSQDVSLRSINVRGTAEEPVNTSTDSPSSSDSEVEFVGMLTPEEKPQARPGYPREDQLLLKQQFINLDCDVPAFNEFVLASPNTYTAEMIADTYKTSPDNRFVMKVRNINLKETQMQVKELMSLALCYKLEIADTTHAVVSPVAIGKGSSLKVTSNVIGKKVLKGKETLQELKVANFLIKYGEAEFNVAELKMALGEMGNKKNVELLQSLLGYHDCLVSTVEEARANHTGRCVEIYYVRQFCGTILLVWLAKEDWGEWTGLGLSKRFFGIGKVTADIVDKLRQPYILFGPMQYYVVKDSGSGSRGNPLIFAVKHWSRGY